MKLTLLLLVAATPWWASAAESSPAALVLEKSIPLEGIHGGFNHHSADGKRHLVFVCASSHQSVEVVDLVSGKIVKSLPGAKPSATCYAADLNLLAVSRGSHVELYDGTSFALVATVVAPCTVDELRYDAAAKQLLAGCMTAPNEGIAVIDLVAKKLVKLIKSPHPQGFCFEDGGGRVFVSTPRSAQVTALDRKTGAAAAAWKLADAAGNYPIDFDPMTHRLFVGCRRPTKLVVLDSDTGKEIARTDIGEDTDDLAFDRANRRVYVACGEGVISVVEQDGADRYRTVATVTSGSEARNCVFVPETEEFCVTVPEHDNQSAALLVYRAQSRRP